ncbi:MAG: glycosyltransferase family 2 protein [Arachnia sp.]
MTDAVEVLRTAVATLLHWLAWPLLLYFVVGNAIQLLLIMLATGDSLSLSARQRREAQFRLMASRSVPGISVVASMFNEEAGIVEATRSMLSLNYPSHEVILVDDGSKDASFDALAQAFDLVEVPTAASGAIEVRQAPESTHVARDSSVRLTVLRKPNSGRADSLNCAINTAREELVLFVDADSLLDPRALLSVAKPFADDPVRTVAVGGVIRAVNGCEVRSGRVVSVRPATSWLPRIQGVEYLRAFHLGRAGWARLNSLLLISGAFGTFRRDILLEVGGLDADSIGEDFELVMRIHRMLRLQRRPYRIRFVTEPICWTEVPSTWRVLSRQRSRWHRGLWETLWQHKGMLFNPRYGHLGFVAVPHYWLFELFAPLFEAGGLVLLVLGLLLGLVNTDLLVAFAVVSYLFSTVVTLVAVLAEELVTHRNERARDIATTIAASVVEQFGYRQATLWFRLKGWWASLRRREQVWGVMSRTGFGGTPPALPPPPAQESTRPATHITTAEGSR